MTTPRYPEGCAAGSQVRGIASPAAYSPSDYAWNVNFDNGNANWNDQDNHGFVRAVRAGECQGAVSFRDLHTAWRAARRAKRPSCNQLAFEIGLIDNLIALEEQLNTGAWRPAPSTCFIAKRPKAREIHAPDFRDRVVHHWLVPQLEAIFEPLFIHDVYSNRVGKGTHAAVETLGGFVRQVHNGEGGGWYLQLDIRNFFNTIHRPTLYALLKRRIGGLSLAARRTTHALLRQSPAKGKVIWACTPEERAAVPLHKRLDHAPPGCGIAIGNLSSQFFANVLLNELDQFVKHRLKARRYVRYVDDFVLVHHDRQQLRTWKRQIEAFLLERLRLTLKDDVRLKPLQAGVDFLGYVIFPTHSVVRRRVIQHAREKLQTWERAHVAGRQILATPSDFRALRSVCASYAGHFRHANSARLRSRLREQFPWLRTALHPKTFDHRLEGRIVCLTRECHGR